MILAKDALLSAIKKGEIKISPFNNDQVGTGSINLSLGNEFRVFYRHHCAIPVREEADFKKITRAIKRDSYVLKPGELVLGITKENVKLADDLCGWIQGRSRFARLGLVIHITAAFIQPGVNNKTVLEIYNAGPCDLELIPGERLCQLIVERTDGKGRYKGKYKSQVGLR
ncbi:MAG: dCTP deaminase [Candidatus Nanoarchaeia archaeon]